MPLINININNNNNTTSNSNLKSPSPPPSMLTIADILVLEEQGGASMRTSDDDNDNHGCTVIRCSPPGGGPVVGMLSALRRWRKKKKMMILMADKGFHNNKNPEKKKLALNQFDYNDDNPDRSPAQGQCSMNGFNGADLPHSISRNRSQTGRNSPHASSDVGIGYCMLYLLAASRNEFDKMTELRKQMETLLQNAKQQLQTTDNSTSKLSQVKHIAARLMQDAEDSTTLLSPCILGEASNSSTTNTRSLSSMASKGISKPSVPKPDESTYEMDRLQVELEAELERLQLHLDKDLNYSDQKLEVNVSDTTTSQSFNTSFGEVIDPYEEPYNNEEHYGVSPYELERRLHELLETRQKEEIQELETALKHATQKLLEKETEISWWKDTAHLIMQHLPEPFRCNLNAEKHDIQ